MIHLPEAQQINRGTRVDNGKPVIVAVLDTGIDPDHPAFAGRLVPGFDFVGNDSDPREEGVLRQNPVYGHGTHVAGIIALTAPEAKIMPIRVLDANGEGELWRVVAAIVWAANHGADVINISFGYDVEPKLLKNLLDNCDTPPAGTQLFPELNGNKLVVISGAGNGGNAVPIYPAGTPMDPQLGVGASTRLDNLAEFSTMSLDNGGGSRSIRAVAPGEDIISTLPGGRYGMWSGTSMAAPIAAGVAALVKAKNPQLDPHLIVGQIAETGIKWDCDHPTRGPIKTARIDALCAITNNTACGSNPQACAR
jgi:subtilisin family serine protease